MPSTDSVDFGAAALLVVEFERNTPDPARVFRAATAMIDALAEIDRNLAAGAEARLKPEPIPIDIQAGSTRTWIGNRLRDVPDDVLRAGEVRPIVGALLSRPSMSIGEP